MRMDFSAVKMVAVDLDGTLLTTDKKMPDDFKPWVLAHPGIHTVIASGRQYDRLLHQFADIHDHLVFIAENGSLVVDQQGKIIFSSPMSSLNIRKTLDFIHLIPSATPVLCGIHCAYSLPSGEGIVKNLHIYYQNLKSVSSFEEAMKEDTIIKIAVFEETGRIGDYEKLFPQLTKEVHGVISDKKWADFANTGINKGKAIQAILSNFHLSKSNAMAFGDYGNDKEMLKEVYYSYAMENATEEIKSVANFQTDSNDHDGVMKILRQIQ